LSLFVDTSVWSQILRRDTSPNIPEVEALARSVDLGEQIYTTGFVLQELLQGFAGPKARGQILDKFSSLPSINPDRSDHIDAADVFVTCRRAGVQIGAIDALITHLCIRHSLVLLSCDADFTYIAKHTALKLWRAS
jgi:predicted nucleic acid-binding protein